MLQSPWGVSMPRDAVIATRKWSEKGRVTPPVGGGRCAQYRLRSSELVGPEAMPAKVERVLLGSRYLELPHGEQSTPVGVQPSTKEVENAAE